MHTHTHTRTHKHTHDLYRLTLAPPTFQTDDHSPKAAFQRLALVGKEDLFGFIVCPSLCVLTKEHQSHTDIQGGDEVEAGASLHFKHCLKRRRVYFIASAPFCFCGFAFSLRKQHRHSRHKTTSSALLPSPCCPSVQQFSPLCRIVW